MVSLFYLISSSRAKCNAVERSTKTDLILQNFLFSLFWKAVTVVLFIVRPAFYYKSALVPRLRAFHFNQVCI